MTRLPLREDFTVFIIINHFRDYSFFIRLTFQENTSVLQCFLHLARLGHSMFPAHLARIMDVTLTMISQQSLLPGKFYQYYSFICK